MRRVPLEAWSGFAMLVVCLVVGAYVVLSPVTLRVPLPVWLLLYAATVAMIVAAATIDYRRVWARRGAYVAALVLSWCVLLAAPEAETQAVMVALTAAIGATLLRLRVVLVIVALNSAVLAAAWFAIRDEPANLLFSVGFYVLIQLASVLSMAALLREQRIRAELTEAHVELQSAGVLLEESTRTAERLRISRDLHDLIGHQLTVLTLELEAARHREGERTRGHVEQANRVARELLANVRSTVDTLRVAPSGDLAEALRKIGRDIPNLDIAVDVRADVGADEEQASVLVRATKEIVTNALRHAEARELWIDVLRDGDTIQLIAADDGCGARDLVPGNGLKGLSERFEALGGGVEWDGATGFKVAAWVPAR